jgi:cytochrome c oxidase subunit 3
MSRRILDVSGLPTTAFGPRDPLWWSVICLIAIEGSMLVLLAVSYAYVADRTHPFPPVHLGRTLAWIATADMLLWLLSSWPQRRTSKAAVRRDLPAMRRNLIVATLIAIVALVVRIYVMMHLPFRWDSHAYGSVVWGLLAVHFTHGITGIGEDALYCVLLFVGPVEDKHRTDIEVSAPLVYFVAAGGILIWALVFLPTLIAGPT